MPRGYSAFTMATAAGALQNTRGLHDPPVQLPGSIECMTSLEKVTVAGTLDDGRVQSQDFEDKART